MQAFYVAYVEPLFLKRMCAQRPLRKIHIVHGCYLVFSAFAFRHFPDFLKDAVVIYIQTRNHEVAFGFQRFLLYVGHLAVAIYLCDPETLGVRNLFQKYGRALLEFLYSGGYVVEDDVVAEEEYAIVIAYIIFRDMEAVRDAIGFVLDSVDYLYLPGGCRCCRYKTLSRAEQFHERIDVVRRGNNHYLGYTRVD